jgi:UPF0755 protein
LRALFSLFLLAALAAGGWLAWALLLPVAPGGQKFVMLRPGFSTRHIANELKAAGVIRSADAFILWHYAHDQRSLKAGEYLFDKTADARTIHDRLARGDIYVHTVVIPEGYNMFDIAQAIQDAGLGPKEEFLKVAQGQTALIADLAPEAKSLEGYLFPNTYEFTRTQSVTDMASAMVKQFRQVAREIGLTTDVQKVVTMASIVEKETAVPEERPTVAGVYFNRLAKKIALQADPSVIYYRRAPTAARCTMKTCWRIRSITLTNIPDCRRGRSRIRGRRRYRRRCIRRRRIIFILWRTALGDINSRTTWMNTTGMWRLTGRSC